jgi:prevent-host-death family protein
MKEISFSEVENDLARYLRLAEQEEIVITRDGRPIGALVGFASEDAWIDYCVQHDLRIWRQAHEQPLDEPRIAGLHAGTSGMSEDFDDPLPDEFWTGES